MKLPIRFIEADMTPIGGSAGGWIVPINGNEVDVVDIQAALDHMGFAEGLHYRLLTTEYFVHDLEYGDSTYVKRLKRVMLFDDQSFIFAKMVLG